MSDNKKKIMLVAKVVLYQ